MRYGGDRLFKTSKKSVGRNRSWLMRRKSTKPMFRKRTRSRSRPKPPFQLGHHRLSRILSLLAFGVEISDRSRKAPAARKTEVDVSGVAVGSAVAHAKFGIGKVIELNRGYVTVRFEQGEKRFIFPDAFEFGFLKAQ